MTTVELTSGPIEYEDTGGTGPVIVFIHGLLIDASLWSDVIADLREEYRCVVPTLPLGGHRKPMREGADLSMHGQARLVAEFLERLDLSDVTLVANDWGGPQITAVEHPERLAALVLVATEAFDNVPPGLPGKFAVMLGRIPGGLFVAGQTLRIPMLRRLPITFGWMAKRPLPNTLMKSWIAGLRSDRSVRRDAKKYIVTSDYKALNAAARGLSKFDKPALVVWATEDRVMPRIHGSQLADLLPNGRLVEIDDSYTLVPLDQPIRLASEIRAFMSDD